MITQIRSTHHYTQGKVKIWRLCSKFLLVLFRIGMSRENNSFSIHTAQLSSANSAVRFAWFHKFSEPLPGVNTWAHSRCRSTAWSLGAVQRKFSNFKLIPLNIPPRPTLFIAKAGITLNYVSWVSHDNLLMNATSHWHRLCKNHTGWSRIALHMPRNEVDSEANGFTKTTSDCQPFPKQTLAHEQFLCFIFINAKPWGILDISWGMLWT